MSFGKVIEVKLYETTGGWTKALYVSKGPLIRGMESVMAIIDGGVAPVAFPFYR